MKLGNARFAAKLFGKPAIFALCSTNEVCTFEGCGTSGGSLLGYACPLPVILGYLIKNGLVILEELSLELIFKKLFLLDG
jgi:hypothetical protein